jgi:hypothetical protein
MTIRDLISNRRVTAWEDVSVFTRNEQISKSYLFLFHTDYEVSVGNNRKNSLNRALLVSVRIRIRAWFTVQRIRIQRTKSKRICADPDLGFANTIFSDFIFSVLKRIK